MHNHPLFTTSMLHVVQYEKGNTSGVCLMRYVQVVQWQSKDQWVLFESLIPVGKINVHKICAVM